MTGRGRTFKWLVALLLLLGLGWGGYEWYRGRTNQDGAAVVRPTTASNLNGTSLVASAPRQAAPDSAAVLRELREAYIAGSLAARIRLQGELAERWTAQPPAAREVIAACEDRGAAADYRIYVGRAFRNLAKSRRLNDAEVKQVTDRILGVVANADDDPIVRGEFADVVARFDTSARAVAAIGALLRTGPDDAAVLAVNALRHLGTDEAASAIIAFLAAEADSPSGKPKTVVAGLTGIVGYTQANPAPTAQAILTRTNSPQVALGALACLSRLRSSDAVVDAILVAYDRAAEIDPSAAERVRSAAIGAMRHHSQFISNPTGPSMRPNLSRAQSLIRQP